MVKFEFRNIRRYVHTAVIMEPSNVTLLCHSMASSVKSPNKRMPNMKKQWAELNKMEF
jgi:hypothetical protein